MEEIFINLGEHLLLVHFSFGLNSGSSGTVSRPKFLPDKDFMPQTNSNKPPWLCVQFPL